MLLPMVLERKKPNERKPTSTNKAHTYFTKDPYCDTCKMTKSMSARCKNRPDMWRDGLEPPKEFGEIITADHMVLAEENESRMQHFMVQDFFSFGF